MTVGIRDNRGRTVAMAAAIGTLGSLLWLGAACAAASANGRSNLQDSPPATASVRDGIGTDLDSQETADSLFANWDPFLDPEGLPVVYEWGIGLRPGATDVQPWTSVGGSTHAATSGGTLPAGSKLYVSVRASDIAGHRSAVATSNGITLGIPAPARRSPSVVGRGTGADDQLLTVERFGTKWTFDRPMPCGRYVNGDWWVVGPVSIVGISPQCRTDDGRVRHGSMINPDPRATSQAYDSAMFGEGGGGRYDAASNVALGVSPHRPLRLAVGSSLVSATSHVEPGRLPQLESCAVLTCVAQAVPEGAFRPPYCGTDKTSRWSVANLALNRLARLEAPPGGERPADLVERFEQTWLDHLTGWTSRFLHPSLSMPDYGRDLADLVGRGALVLQMDYPDEQKRPLAIAMVQVGLDLYGIVENGGRFLADGGSGSGRKFPVLLAGALLQDERILTCAKMPGVFAEDAQTFYVAETTAGIWNQGYGGYGPEDVGLPEWGNRHADDASFDMKSWTGDPFRRCCTANVWHGYVLAARIMGLREAWDHQALFDYVDRYMQVEPSGAWTRSFNPMAGQMWDRYRAAF